MFKSKEAAQVVIFYSAAGPQQYGFLLICLLQDKMTVFNYYIINVKDIQNSYFFKIDFVATLLFCCAVAVIYQTYLANYISLKEGIMPPFITNYIYHIPST